MLGSPPMTPNHTRLDVIRPATMAGALAASKTPPVKKNKASQIVTSSSHCVEWPMESSTALNIAANDS
jgi:hypothetical protein